MIPSWLNGTLVRNGPGLQQIGADKYQHMFDGLALIHSFHIRNGRVDYMNRFVKSEAYNRNIKANRIVVSEFGTGSYPDPCKTIWQRFMSNFIPELTDNANVSLTPVADHLFATTETNFLHRIDPKTLETQERVDLSRVVTINTSTSHPHFDGNFIYNLGSSFGPFGKYCIIKIPNIENGLEKASIVCSVRMERPLHPSYYHSFSLTKNYYIFIEQPLVLSLKKAALGQMKGKSLSSLIRWRPKQKVSPFSPNFSETDKMFPNFFDTKDEILFNPKNRRKSIEHKIFFGTLCFLSSNQCIRRQ